MKLRSVSSSRFKFWFVLDGEHSEQKVRRLHDAGETTIAANCDEVAAAILNGMRRAGLRCPADIAVIGVDGMATNEAMEPPLSSIDFDFDLWASFTRSCW